MRELITAMELVLSDWQPRQSWPWTSQAAAALDKDIKQLERRIESAYAALETSDH